MRRGKYYVREEIPEERVILKTTLLYHDGKTQVPRKVIELLGLEPGSTIVWVAEGGRIYIEPAKQKKGRNI